MGVELEDTLSASLMAACWSAQAAVDSATRAYETGPGPGRHDVTHECLSRFQIVGRTDPQPYQSNRDGRISAVTLDRRIGLDDDLRTTVRPDVRREILGREYRNQ